MTFALREALWALVDIERELGAAPAQSLKQVVLGAMYRNPRYWKPYYTNPASETFDLQYSLSDRIRYYWSVPEVQESCDALLTNLQSRGIPLTLLSQYLPAQYAAVRAGALANDPRELLLDAVGQALKGYAQACRPAAEADDDVRVERQGNQRGGRRVDRPGNPAAARGVGGDRETDRRRAQPVTRISCVRCWRVPRAASCSPAPERRRTLANVLRRRSRGVWSRRVDAIPTTDLVASPQSFLSPATPTLMVSFGRSGNSPESVAAVRLADSVLKDCAHLIVTCDAGGALAQYAGKHARARVVTLPERSNDRSFAMTSSFTGMLLTGGLVLGAVRSDSARMTALEHMAARVLPERVPLLQDLVRMGFERVVYLGSKEFKGLAREAALKMLELTDGKVVAVADSPLGFRHGPKTILNAKTLVVVFAEQR